MDDNDWELASIWETPGKPIQPGDQEGFVKVLGFNIFYRSYGKDGKKGSVICLHGGPGGIHHGLRPLVDLTNYGYRVVLYDQLGSGNSQVPKNKELLNVEHFVEEVEAVRYALGLDKISLVGWSWGGTLAMAYGLRYQDHLKAMVTTGSPANIPLCYQEMLRLKKELPREVQATMEKYESEGDYENPAYKKAAEVFYRNFVCRLQEWPPEMLYAMQNHSKFVYETMWGPNEFVCVGTLRYWNITDELRDLKMPMLITCGRYDEVTPTTCRSAHEHIKGSKFEIFEKSAHSALWEEREKYLELVRVFLDKNQ